MKAVASVKLVKDLCFLGGTEILFFWMQTQVEDNEGKPHIPAVRKYFFLSNKLVSRSALEETEFKEKKKKLKKRAAAFTLVIDEGRNTEDTIKKVVPQKCTLNEMYQIWTDYDGKILTTRQNLFCEARD